MIKTSYSKKYVLEFGAWNLRLFLVLFFLFTFFVGCGGDEIIPDDEPVAEIEEPIIPPPDSSSVDSSDYINPATIDPVKFTFQMSINQTIFTKNQVNGLLQEVNNLIILLSFGKKVLEPIQKQAVCPNSIG